MPERILIGLDDTDTPGGRGTGFQAMQLGEMITTNGLGEVKAISRHQLLPDHGLSATSDNSAACIELFSSNIDALVSFCVPFISNESAPDAQPGICLARWDKIPESVVQWGQLAKVRTLNLLEAQELALQSQIILQGLAGSKAGIIGALAAVGLRKSGNDGRFLWLKRLRDLSGIYSAEDLLALVGADIIQTLDNHPIHPDDLVEVGEWFRPVNKNHQITIIVEKQVKDSTSQWITASRANTQQYSDLSD